MINIKSLPGALNNKIGFFALYRLYLRSQKIQLGSKIFFRRRPIIINNGTMSIGNRVTFDSLPDGEFCRVRVITNKNGKITIGHGSTLRGTTIWASTEITIGDNFLSAPFAWIVDNDAHGIHPARRGNNHAKSTPVKIGNNVWVGYRAIILKGVTIGDNSIIAAGAIVTKDIPANCIAAGVPAAIVKQIG